MEANEVMEKLWAVFGLVLFALVLAVWAHSRISRLIEEVKDLKGRSW